MDVATGTVAQVTDRKGPDSGPVPSPDGQWVAYTGYDWNRDTYNVSGLYVMRADGTEARLLAPDLDRAISGLMWTKDRAGVLFTARAEGARDLWRADLGGGVRRLTTGAHQFAATDVDARGLVVGTWTTPSEPGDLASVQLRGDAAEPLQQLTRVNDDLLAHVDLGAVEEIRYPSVGGREIQGWVVKPPDFDPSKTYPLILQIHGGPHGMYGWRFSFERQEQAARGFVVLYTNPRGSVGYGKDFGNAINNAYPGQDYDDLMNGVDAVLAKGWIDPDQLFVYGGSGGGVLTCWIVGKTDRFAAAVSMYPVTNWISFVGTTDGPYWYDNFAKLPWEGIEEHWQRSPLRLVGNVTTPTLLLTGELDLRTPMAQTEEYYQALKLRKVDTAMVRMAGEYHGAARRPSNRLRRMLYVRGWFEKYREEQAVPVPAAATSSPGDG
ncbi:MAG: S9 family peptidase [Planctomycetota bacterium]